MHLAVGYPNSNSCINFIVQFIVCDPNRSICTDFSVQSTVCDPIATDILITVFILQSVILIAAAVLITVFSL